MKNDLVADHLLKQYVTVTLPVSALLDIVEPSSRSARAESFGLQIFGGLPSIGSAFQGGVYAGLSLENERPVALVLVPGDADDLTWEQAKAWAAEKESSLPSRIDHLVLFKNLKSEFKETAYWSDTLDAGDESWAWCQGFDYGGQYDVSKSSKLRARAVRRIAISHLVI